MDDVGRCESDQFAFHDYPVQDAYLSTVIGTGTANEGTLPKQVPTRMR